MSYPFQCRKEDDLDQEEKLGVTTLHELVHNLWSAFILKICSILLPFKVRRWYSTGLWAGRLGF
jgi:hypothetical protein